MKLVVCRLSEEQHEGLRRLAFERRMSIAELIRRAVEIVYREDLEDIRDMEAELARYRAEPGSAVHYDQYRQEREERARRAASVSG